MIGTSPNNTLSHDQEPECQAVLWKEIFCLRRNKKPGLKSQIWPKTPMKATNVGSKPYVAYVYTPIKESFSRKLRVVWAQAFGTPNTNTKMCGATCIRPYFRDPIERFKICRPKTLSTLTWGVPPSPQVVGTRALLIQKVPDCVIFKSKITLTKRYKVRRRVETPKAMGRLSLKIFGVIEKTIRSPPLGTGE